MCEYGYSYIYIHIIYTYIDIVIDTLIHDMIWRKEIAAESPRAELGLWIDRPQLPPRIHFDGSRVAKRDCHGEQ